MIHRRHAEHVLAAVSRADELTGTEREAGLAEIARRHDDVRAALDWADAAGDGELALRRPPRRVGSGSCAGTSARGRHGWRRRWRQRAPGDSHIRARACMRAGLIADSLLDLASAKALFDEALAIRRRARRSPWRAGRSQQPREPRAPVRRLRRRSARARGGAGDRTRDRGPGERRVGATRISRSSSSWRTIRQRQPSCSKRVSCSPAPSATATGSPSSAGTWALRSSISANSVAVRPASPRAFACSASLDAPEIIAPTLEDLAALAFASGDANAAARRLGAAAALRAGLGTAIGRSDADRAARTEVRARLRDWATTAFERAFGEGRRLTLQEAIELASREASAAVVAPG